MADGDLGKTGNNARSPAETEPAQQRQQNTTTRTTTTTTTTTINRCTNTAVVFDVDAMQSRGFIRLLTALLLRMLLLLQLQLPFITLYFRDGTSTRTRPCNWPAPQRGGAGCSGDRTKTKPCNLSPCPGKCPAYLYASPICTYAAPGCIKIKRFCKCFILHATPSLRSPSFVSVYSRRSYLCQ